jgi:hypothetical protein
MKNDLIGLIDADFLKYLVAYDIERMFKNGLKPDAVIPYNTVCNLTEKRIDTIRRETESRTKVYLFLFSGKTRDNFRSAIACEKKYKGQRSSAPKYPLEGEYRSMVERYVEENYAYFKQDDLEADDLCVMAHENDTYIYSKDKDLAMSPGIHYNTYTKKWVNTTEDEGFRILMAQTLSGDSVDNIAGAEGVGKVGGPKIVAKHTAQADVLSAVIKTFTDKHGVKAGLDRFVEMYTLVNLRTNRGAWTKERYSEFFETVEQLRAEDFGTTDLMFN